MAVSIGGIGINTYVAGSIPTKGFDRGPVFSIGLSGAPGVPSECTPQFIWDHGSEVAYMEYDALEPGVRPHTSNCGLSSGFVGLNKPGWTLDCLAGEVEYLPGAPEYRYRYVWYPGGVYYNGDLVEPRFTNPVGISNYYDFYNGYLTKEWAHYLAVEWESSDGGAPLYLLIGARKSDRYDSEGEVAGSDFMLVAGSAVYINFNPIAYDLDFQGYVPPVPPGPDHDPNEDDPESTTGEDGGDGSHEPDYDPIPIPPLPDKGAATSGFLTMYKLGTVQMNQFANDMFASDIWEAIKLFFSNPIDFLVGCMLLPFEPDTGSSYYPKFGVKKFAHAYPAVSNQYKTVDCGSIDIRKYWGSAFDFDPYTRLQIWLPYIGYRDLPTDEVMDTTIGVVYHIDCLTGDCVAFVHRGVVGQTGPQIPRVIGQFYGNCGVRVPFGSVSFDAAIAAGVSLLTGAISTAGNITAGQIDQVSRGQEVNHEAALTRMATQLTASTINVVASTKPNIQKGGAAGASTGYMSIQKPYLIRRIPRQNLPDGYKDFHGYPANIRSTLGELGGGYAEIDDIQLNDIPAFENERREIIEWLKGGVLL